MRQSQAESQDPDVGEELQIKDKRKAQSGILRNIVKYESHFSAYFSSEEETF